MKKQSFLLLFVITVAFLVVFGNRFLPFPERIHAQLPPASTEEASLERKVEVFFRHLQANTSTATTAAFEEIFQDGSSVTRISSEAVAKMSERFMELSSSSELGRLRDHEKIITKPIGKDVILLKYLTKHDNAPALWSFTFYRPPRTGSTPTTSGGLDLVHVRFDTNLESAM